MSPTSRVWGACRTLAVRTRPAPPRTQPLLTSVSRTRWYSDEKIDKRSGQSDETLKAAQAQPAATEGSPIDALGDEALHQVFYGGRTSPSEADGGLTTAQEQSLYHSGRIPSPDDAAAVVEAADDHTVAVTRRRARAKLPHKFPLPPKPFPTDFNHKKRYHPVLDLLVRLIMRDGKLSQAQRVCIQRL